MSATPSKAAAPASRFASTYNSLFSGKDPSHNQESFWEELFLLKVNDDFIRSSIAQISEDELSKRAHIFNMLFKRCVATMTDSNQIRAANAVQTLGLVMSSVFAKSGFPTFGYDVLNVVIGFDSLAQQMNALINAVRHVLNNERSAAELKELILCLLIVIVTATDNINQNALVGVLMDNCLFDDLLKLLDERTEREKHGFDVLLLLGLLVNYKKPESQPTSIYDANGKWAVKMTDNSKIPNQKASVEARRWNVYAEQLEDLTDDITLNAIGSVVSSSFLEDTRSWTSLATVEIKSSTITSWLANLLQDSVEELPKLSIVPAECGAVLLSLYETIKLNAGFITVITHTQVLQEPSPDEATQSRDIAESSAKVAVPDTDSRVEPANLLSTFLSFSSFLMHEKGDGAAKFHKLCWIILTRICEDDHANEFLHTSEVPVSLYYGEMRHRAAEIKSVQSGPLAAALLDMSIEFLISHLKKELHAELYALCLGVIHRLLCYQKDKHIRLAFNWKSLWGGLVAVAGFLVRHEQALLARYNIFVLGNEVVNIFNIFITYGDTFLPDPASYDELYYEVIRVQSTFDALYDMAKRHERGAYSESAEKLAIDLCNIRAITNHFNPLISRWKSTHGVHSLTPDQVLHVVNENYETLTLKIKGTLTYDPYVEEPSDAAYFQQLVLEVMLAHKNVDFRVTAIPITK